MALLELNTEATQEVVNIDGVEYPLPLIDAFSITELHALQRDGERLVELSKVQDMSPEQAAELESISGRQFRSVARFIPPEVQTKLSTRARLLLIQAYFLAEAVKEKSRQAQTDSPRTGFDLGSLPSAGSTEEQ